MTPEPIRLYSGQPYTITTGQPVVNIILSMPTYFEGCYVGACPYHNDEFGNDDREPDVPLDSLTPVEWIPGVGLVDKGKK